MQNTQSALASAMAAVFAERFDEQAQSANVDALSRVVAAEPWLSAFKKRLKTDIYSSDASAVIDMKGSCALTSYIGVDLTVRISMFEGFAARQLNVTVTHHPEGEPVVGVSGVLMSSQLPAVLFDYAADEDLDAQLSDSIKEGIEAVLDNVDKRSRLIQGYVPKNLTPRQYAEQALVPEQLQAQL